MINLGTETATSARTSRSADAVRPTGTPSLARSIICWTCPASTLMSFSSHIVPYAPLSISSAGCRLPLSGGVSLRMSCPSTARRISPCFTPSLSATLQLEKLPTTSLLCRMNHLMPRQNCGSSSTKLRRWPPSDMAIDGREGISSSSASSPDSPE